MKVSKLQAAAHRDAMLDAAARLYLERGLVGAGVAEISAEAGLTHGGFYGHFASKQALAAEACTRAFQRSLQRMIDEAGKHHGDLLPALRTYLSADHRDGIGTVCPAPALSAEAARLAGPVPEAFAGGIAGLLQQLAWKRPGGADAGELDETDKQRAVETLATLVGGIVLARATAEAMPALSDEILERLRARLAQDWRPA
ncbi:MAG: TetR/AcrR family transcriptional regulator [Proteobacteria bacterium]|nr:TetR/AcrR family transcriptional regulator [Pseudomonadota bacterium]